MIVSLHLKHLNIHAVHPNQCDSAKRNLLKLERFWTKGNGAALLQERMKVSTYRKGTEMGVADTKYGHNEKSCKYL